MLRLQPRRSIIAFFIPRRPHSAGAEVAAVEIGPDGSTVQLTWKRNDAAGCSEGNGDTSVFHRRWLYYNAPNHVHSATGQRTIEPEAVASPPAITRVATVAGGAALQVTWGSDMISEYPATWLHARDYSRPALAAARTAATPPALGGHSAATTNATRDGSRGNSRERSRVPYTTPEQQRTHPAIGRGEIPTFEYADVMSSERAVWRWLQALNEYGLTLIRNAPTTERTVLQVGARVAHPMHTIYGDAWDVAVMANPINIAYAPVGLDVHVDLVYYESPPGLQLLHCREFDSHIIGGESTFIDGFLAAEELRRRDPAAFMTLTRVPATFQKVHYDREWPVHIVAARPHIAVDSTLHSEADAAAGAGDVTGVFWAPQFEGPLRVPPEHVDAYYEAYAAFARVLRDVERDGRFMIEFRMQPGDISVFNNRRMLHGRRVFGLPPESPAVSAGAAGAQTAVDAGGAATRRKNGSRLLQGCYVNIDEYKSRLMYLCHKYGGLDAVKRVANQQWF